MILWLKKHTEEKISHDECSRCIDRLCCVVFDICSTSYQGRKSDMIKKGGLSCTHIGENGDCEIYHEREYYDGYRENCITYSCDNIGPLVNIWLRKNQISIHENSREIGLMIQRFQAFLHREKDREIRYSFLEALFDSRTSLSDIGSWGDQDFSLQEDEFVAWIKTRQ